MFKEFKQRLNDIKFKVSSSRDAEPPSPDSSLTLHHLQMLEDVVPTHEQVQGVWQNKLPPEILFYLIEDFLDNDKSAIVALSSTCRSMYTLFLPKRYSHVTLNTSRGVVSTRMETFALIAAKRPYVLKFIQRLTLLDEGFMFQGSRPMTAEEECLCYILTRRLCYPNLKRLDLSFRVVWDLLPEPVKSACLDIFSLPSLYHVCFHYMAIPSNILGHLPGISTLEMKGEVRSFSPTEIPLPDDPKLWCTPKKLILWDTTRTGFVIENMLSMQSGLLLGSVEHLEVRVHYSKLSLLEETLSSCQSSLTHLTIHCPHSYSARLPLQLSFFTRLESLMLSVDSSMMRYPGTSYIERNFDWLLDTISTLPKPTNVQFLTVTVRVMEFSLAVKRLPWMRLDRLFKPGVTVTWPHLKKIDVVLVKELNSAHVEPVYGNAESLLNSQMPLLSSSDVFSISLSRETMKFW